VILDSEKATIESVKFSLNSFKIKLSEKVVRDTYRGWQFSKVDKALYIYGQDSAC
jgi:hypothetical protein